MFRTKNNRVRLDYIGEGESFEFSYSIDRESDRKKEEKELEKMAQRVKKTMTTRYKFVRDERIKLECLDDLFDLIAIPTEVTHFDENGKETYKYIATEFERKELDEMFARVKHGLELVAKEEREEMEMAEKLEEQAKEHAEQINHNEQ